MDKKDLKRASVLPVVRKLKIKLQLDLSDQEM